MTHRKRPTYSDISNEETQGWSPAPEKCESINPEGMT